MSLNDDKKNRFHLKSSNYQYDEDDMNSGGAQSGGKIEFKDFLGASSSRDDLLTGDEKRHLLVLHKDTHELRVKKQKELRDQRQILKEGKNFHSSYQQGLMHGRGQGGGFKPNPRLADKAQFSGIDKQVIGLPNENIANTNEENRNELQLQHQNQLRYTRDHTPRLTR